MAEEIKNTTDIFFDDKKIELIVKYTCLHFGLNPAIVFSQTRKNDHKTARQVIHYLAKKHTKKSLDAIGKVSLAYGRPRKHDHATVLHSSKTVNNLMETDNDYARNVKKIEYNFKRSVLELSPEDLSELKTIELNQRLEQIILEKTDKIESLKSAISIIKQNITDSSDNIYLKQLLVMDKKVIENFCETRLKPFLKMLETHVTSDDLVKRQYETRN